MKSAGGAVTSELGDPVVDHDLVVELAERMANVLSLLDVSSLHELAAVRLWEACTALERSAAAAAMLLTRKVASSGQWKLDGYRTPADWLAAKAGGSVGEAKSRLEASKRMEGSATEDAVRDGRLSPEQAEVIADAAAVNPAAEQQLIDHAADAPLKDLRDQCGRAKAAGDPDPEGRERRIRAERGARWWTSTDGTFHFKLNGTVADGSRLTGALAPIIDDLYQQARKGERPREGRDAYAHDAVMRLVDAAESGDGLTSERKRLKYRALLRVDYEALWRGHVEGDELCEITGLGPIPIRTALALLGESTLHLLVTKGQDVHTTVHLGRGVNAAQELALAWSQPMCSNSRCTATWLQDDHRDDFKDVRETRLGNIDELCPHCHSLKTTQAWQLVDGQGRRPLVPPHDPRHPKRVARARARAARAGPAP